MRSGPRCATWAVSKLPVILPDGSWARLSAALRRPGILLGAFVLAIHFYASGSYGIFRDELYFIACGEHPDWGYVDQPPLIPLLAAAAHTLFPDSLRMLRAVPALGHAATIMLTAETARALGGARFAQTLAGLCVLVGGVYLATGTVLSTDALQPLAWLLCAYGLIRIIRSNDQRWWWAIGAIAGVALMTKYMLAFWLIALAIGLLATSSRRVLWRARPWIAAAIAFAIVLPNLLWQAMHDWPFLVIGRVAAEEKNLPLSPLQFLFAEIDFLNGATVPVWLTGLAAFGFWRRFADLRVFAVAFLVLFSVMLAMHAKPYYPVGAYPVLFAGGAVALEAWLRSHLARGALAGALVLSGIIAAPFALPILPIERFVAYQDLLQRTPRPLERGEMGRLPEFYADMFGWNELAVQVAAIYAWLSPEDRTKAVYLASNYGEAAAIEVLDNDLPPAISGHNNYYLWGPRGHDGSVVIRLGGNREALLRAYETVEPAGVFDNPWSMPYERQKILWLCRGRRVPFDQDWASFRNYR
jgi:4-amino-4-deoxy-L-arabinose transferase-like glycosyltransferase